MTIQLGTLQQITRSTLYSLRPHSQQAGSKISLWEVLTHNWNLQREEQNHNLKLNSNQGAKRSIMTCWILLSWIITKMRYTHCICFWYHPKQTNHIGVSELTHDGCLLEKLNLVQLGSISVESLHRNLQHPIGTPPQALLNTCKLPRANTSYYSEEGGEVCIAWETWAQTNTKLIQHCMCF